MRRAFGTFVVQMIAACLCGFGWGRPARCDMIYWAENTAPTGVIKQYDVSTGLVSTLITGTGSGTSGNHIDSPIALTVDKAGNVYVGNQNNGDIVKVTPQGVASDYFAVADPTHYPHTYGLAFDQVGNLYLAWYAQGAVGKLPAGGSTESIIASGLVSPQGGATDPDGNVYVYTNETVAGADLQRITPSGAVSTLATGIADVWFDDAGNLYTGTAAGSITRTSPSGQVSIIATGLAYPDPLGLDGAGNLYVYESGDVSAFDLITPSGQITQLASAPYARGYVTVSVATPEPSSPAPLVLLALLYGTRRRWRALASGNRGS